MCFSVIVNKNGQKIKFKANNQIDMPYPYFVQEMKKLATRETCDAPYEWPVKNDHH